MGSPPYKEFPFSTLDNVQLTGYLAMAAAASPTIIFCHGKGSSHNNKTIQALAEHLFNNGYNVFLFDFRCPPTFGWFEKYDLLAAVDFLTKKTSAAFGAFGVSMGAAALVFAASALPQIKAFIFESIYPDWEKMARIEKGNHIYCFGDKGHQELVGAIKKQLHVNGSIAPINFIDGLADRPVLFIHGKKDQDVPVIDLCAMYKMVKSPKELWLVEEGDHYNCFANNPAEYLRRVLNFFREHL